MITITVDDRAVSEALGQVAARAGNLQPLMEDIGELVLLSVKRNFEDEGRPTPWKKSKRAEEEGGQTLSDKGRLRNSFTVLATGNHVEVGTNVEYAAALHFGTGPRLIKPKKGKALKIPGIGFRKSVRHPGLPARPFLMVQEADEVAILRAASRYILPAGG